MGSVKLVYSTYTLEFSEFTGGELPRNFVSNTSLSRSATGAQVYSGNPYIAKYIWALDVICTEAEANDVIKMYRAFDAERAQGKLPKIVVTDTTFGDNLTADTVVTTPPSISRWGGASSILYAVSFGITQV